MAYCTDDGVFYKHQLVLKELWTWAELVRNSKIVLFDFLFILLQLYWECPTW